MSGPLWNVNKPALLNPVMDASELVVSGRDKGRIALAGGFASHGEPARRVRNKRGKVLPPMRQQVGGPVQHLRPFWTGSCSP